MRIKSKRGMKFLMALVIGLVATSGFAFPSWMGVYGGFERHSDGNPGTFTVLMNQDYYGLNAGVGVQVDGGEWALYEMVYVGNVEGNSMWQFTPGFTFPQGSTVSYYFHGWDDWGGQLWDSDWGNNYSFTVGGGGVNPVSVAAFGAWGGDYFNANGITADYELNFWVDIVVEDLGANKDIGVVWSDDGWANVNVAQASFEYDLGGGYLQYGVDVEPAGITRVHRNGFLSRWFSLDGTEHMGGYGVDRFIGFAVYYTVDGQTYWDNNGGQDYWFNVLAK
ncbi:MAG: CBM21 domain-containing protein [Verrucomicrobia bacterium]|nr:CBM21 domain-containing protein [Verrucomicrobiota bacterium]